MLHIGCHLSSSKGFAAMGRQALELGADEYLTKPCRKERLLARISNVLKRYEGRPNLLEGRGFLLDRQTYTLYLQNRSVVLPQNQGKLLEEISAQELHERCADRLDIAVDDREKYAALLAKHFPEESWRVLPEGTIQIRGFRREPEAYSRLAMEHGLCILGLERKSASLEDYYMNLKNGGKESC